jgi:hypothetical protein
MPGRVESISLQNYLEGRNPVTGAMAGSPSLSPRGKRTKKQETDVKYLGLSPRASSSSSETSPCDDGVQYLEPGSLSSSLFSGTLSSSLSFGSLTLSLARYCPLLLGLVGVIGFRTNTGAWTRSSSGGSTVICCVRPNAHEFREGFPSSPRQTEPRE